MQEILWNRGLGRFQGSCDAAAARLEGLQAGRRMGEEFLKLYCRGPRVKRGGRTEERTSGGRMVAGVVGSWDVGTEGVKRSQMGEVLVA